MKCLHCNGEDFEEKKIRVTPEIKGEEVEVVVSASVCTKCNQPLMNDQQMNQLRRAAADQYRKQHHLLTSEEIIHFREILGMSQIAFAKYLNVGDASIKRWETYFVQEPVQDEHIRLKCDEAYAEFNALNVHWKSNPPDIYSGQRKFSWELFKQAVRYLIETANSPLFLNKALFYADFKHFQLYGVSITGVRYIHLEYGPCPDQYQNLIYFMMHGGDLLSAGHHILKSAKKSDLTVFGDSEKEVLQMVAQLTKGDGGKRLLNLSHQEAAFTKTEPFEWISYEYASTLKI